MQLLPKVHLSWQEWFIFHHDQNIFPTAISFNHRYYVLAISIEPACQYNSVQVQCSGHQSTMIINNDMTSEQAPNHGQCTRVYLLGTEHFILFSLELGKALENMRATSIKE